MKDWLLCFYLEIVRYFYHRQVALLKNNFTEHKCAVYNEEKDNQLSKIHILWLPLFTTATYKPMDQKIIRGWKAYHKEDIIKHIIQQANGIIDDNHYNSTNMFHTVEYPVDEGRNVAKSSTLKNCFSAS